MNTCYRYRCATTPSWHCYWSQCNQKIPTVAVLATNYLPSFCWHGQPMSKTWYPYQHYPCHLIMHGDNWYSLKKWIDNNSSKLQESYQHFYLNSKTTTRTLSYAITVLIKKFIKKLVFLTLKNPYSLPCFGAPFLLFYYP